MNDTIVAGLLGLLEGLTEFIPVSSTGHILLAGHFLGFDSPGRSFEVLVQLGALLAILGIYSARIVQVLTSAPHDPAALRFVGAVLLAFLPAVAIGVLAHGFIKTVLFETPMLVAVMLILGGFVLLPFDIWNKTAFLAERPLGYVVSSGLKVLALAIVVSGARTIFDQLQPSANPDIYEALTILVAALLLARGRGWARGLLVGAEG